jgi:hypothetical protein
MRVQQRLQSSATILLFDTPGKYERRRVRRLLRRLEALAVNDRRTGLVVLLLGDPHLLESGQGSENGTTDPDGVLALGGSDDLDLHGGGSEGSDLLLHTVGDTGVHGGTTRLKRKIKVSKNSAEM